MRIVFTFLTLFILFLLPSAVQARTESIAAVVNEDVISMSDVADRMELIIASSGLPNTQEIRNKLLNQVVGSLVEEQLKLQEAQRLNIEVTPQEIEQGFAAIAAQNKFDPEQFWGMLSKAGINVQTMERQIRAQLAWTKIVQSQIRPEISISDNDIENAIERMNGNAGKYEYLAAEVFLPVEDAKSERDTQQLAVRLVSELRSGKTLFYKVAQQFSKAAGAAEGGDLGWVAEGQLADELNQVLVGMEKEEVSDPIRSAAGYHILFLRDKRQVTGENMPTREQIMTDLGTERLNLMQRRYYLDLKASAFIENRVQS